MDINGDTIFYTYQQTLSTEKLNGIRENRPLVNKDIYYILFDNKIILSEGHHRLFIAKEKNELEECTFIKITKENLIATFLFSASIRGRKLITYVQLNVLE